MNVTSGGIGDLAGYQVQVGQSQANAYAPPPAPQTLASAEGRFCSLNGRLNSLIETAAQIAETIGGPRGVNGEAKGEISKESGIVGRLHLCAENGFAKANYLEELLNSIQRSLGSSEA